MNYENMIGRCQDGLSLIRSVSGDQEVVAHAYMIAVPLAEIEDYDGDQLKNLSDWGWVYHEDFGWVLAVLG